MKRITLILYMLLVFLMSCSSLVKDETYPVLKKYEKKIYILKKDIEIGGRNLKKKQKIKIVVTPGDDWVKIHAFPASIEPLKAERVLILYLFEDDFPDENFDIKVFDKRLYEIVEVKRSGKAAKKNKRRRYKKK